MEVIGTLAVSVVFYVFFISGVGAGGRRRRDGEGDKTHTREVVSSPVAMCVGCMGEQAQGRVGWPMSCALRGARLAVR